MTTATCAGVKVSVGRKAMQDAYSIVSGVVPRQTPRDVLRRLKLEVRGGEATLCGTDLEVQIRCRLYDAEAEGDGAVLLDCDRLGAMLRASSGDRVSIEGDAESIVASVDGCAYRMPAEDPEKFPDAEDREVDGGLTMAASDLKGLIRRTHHAVDRKNRAVILGGLLLELSDGRLYAIGCDGNRLAKSSIAADGEASAVAGRPVVPEKAAKLIGNAMGEGDARLAIRGPNLVVATREATITARLLEGRYPDYERIFPPESEHHARFKAGAVRRAFEMASVVSGVDTRGVEVTFEDNAAACVAGSSHAGRADAETAVSYQGPKFEALLDWQYVLDGFRAAPDEADVVMGATPGCTRILFRFDEYQFVVATMKRGE